MTKVRTSSLLEDLIRTIITMQMGKQIVNVLGLCKSYCVHECIQSFLLTTNSNSKLFMSIGRRCSYVETAQLSVSGSTIAGTSCTKGSRY